MTSLPTSLLRHLLPAHFAATCAMTGVIWYVQIVTYPQFAEVGSDSFPLYHRHYTGLVTCVVAPLMTVEIITAMLIAGLFRDTPSMRGVAFAGLIAVFLLWAVTGLVQLPQHNTLASGFDEAIWLDLVSGNRARAILWTLRLVLAWWLLVAALPPRETIGGKITADFPR